MKKNHREVYIERYLRRMLVAWSIAIFHVTKHTYYGPTYTGIFQKLYQIANIVHEIIALRKVQPGRCKVQPGRCKVKESSPWRQS